MKKIILSLSVIIAVIGIFALLSWQSISTTLGWYILLFNTDNQALSLTPVERILTADNIPQTQTTIFKQLSIPILPNSTPEPRDGSLSLVVKLEKPNSAYYVASLTPLAAEFSANPVLTQEYRDIICIDTPRPQTGNPCETNKAFLSTLFWINPDNVSLLSDRNTKITHSIFTSIKNFYVAADTTTIYSLETDYYTGFLTYSPTVSLAFIFDTAGNEYELSFLSMSEEDVLQVMQGITPTYPDSL